MRIAVVGDIHRHWGPRDVELLDGRGLDLVLFTGDLGDMLHRGTLDVARQIARLRTPAVLVPGNHDGTHPLGVLAEGLGVLRRRPGASRRAARRLDALRHALGPVALGGYSLHPFPRHGLTLVVGRPHGMDERWLTFGQAVGARHGPEDHASSCALLRRLVDRAPPGDLIFLAHDGPAGLGSGDRDPFTFYGRRDMGDPDLADAVAYAAERGRRVLAVVAGHLHHVGTDRDWWVRRDGVLNVNAARVPRVFEDGGRTVRHHVEIRIGAGRADVEQILLS
ncbi:MAG: metallophosphoesterase [Myxococcales bacterium]|nr:metallophosphoesterase [Myxococcales bacterium]